MRRIMAACGIAAMLAGCGGGDGAGTLTSGSNGGGSGGGAISIPAPTPTAGCSLRDRQDWAAAQLREWYLFPDTLPTSLDPAPYASVDGYVDALTATARAQRKDRYFTYLTSIKEEDAYYASGASAGFGFRLGVEGGSGRLFVTESFEGAPALNAGIDRGTEIVAIGTTAANLQNAAGLYMAGGTALDDALGPETPGTARYLQVSDARGTRTVAVTKTDYTLLPVSSRYGAQIISDAGGRFGYLNLRTFISTADPALRDAFARFRAAGVTSVVVDLRYNGGGALSTAQLVGDLLGGNRSPTEVFNYTSFRPDKASENETRLFRPQTQSIAPTRIAFIGTGGTASASELVINAFIPYLHANAALIGTNTYGKPVGQIARDKPECDDRLRLIAFATQNAARQGGYYDGLAATVEASCRADDDIGYPLGDPREASTRAALDFLEGKSCQRIAATASAGLHAQSVPAGRQLLAPGDGGSTAQREVPGLF